MVANYFVYLVLAFLLYAYTNHNREFNATASAIRQIWSGTCRLSCRQSEYSGFSGLSGIVRQQSQNIGSLVTQQVKEGQDTINDQAGPSTTCVCETCPCTVIETVLIICSPATNLYCWVIEMLSSLYYEAVIALTDLYVYIERVLDCGVSCQRPAQTNALKFHSAESIHFAHASSSVKDNSVKNSGKQLKVKPSAFLFRRQSENEYAKTELHTSTGGHNIALNLAPDSVKPKSESEESAKVTKSCSKCSEKGEVCMNNCPRSKEKKL